jgi:hypothetical protein
MPVTNISGELYMRLMQKVVTPVKTGAQANCTCLKVPDSGFRRDDENMRIPTFCVTVIHEAVKYPIGSGSRRGFAGQMLDGCIPGILSAQHATPTEPWRIAGAG